MIYPNLYNKLKIIAEMEEHWDDPDTIAERLVKDGYYTETGRNTHPDRARTLRDQIAFMRDIKKILSKHKA